MSVSYSEGPEVDLNWLQSPLFLGSWIIEKLLLIFFSLFSFSGLSSQQQEPARVNGQEVRFFTPVRRSVRIERASLRYPVSLQDHDLCVASYNDLISEEDKETTEEQKDWENSPSAIDTPMYIYRENEALKDKVLVKLVCDEGVQLQVLTSSPCSQDKMQMFRCSRTKNNVLKCMFYVYLCKDGT